MIPAGYFLALSLALFGLGILGFFLRKDLITQFMSVEVMLNAANLMFLAFSRMHGTEDGQVIVLFIITTAAAEAAVGLAIILHVFRKKKSVRTEDYRELKG